MAARLILTASQIRMARACLRWSVDHLSRETGLSTSTIRRMEAQDDVPGTTTDAMSRIQLVFEHHGVVFLSDDDPAGAGVRFRPINQD